MELETFLNENGASSILRILNEDRYIHERDNLFLIVAPTDAAIDNFLQAQGDQISEDELRGILRNHFSVTYHKGEGYPMFISVDGFEFGSSYSDFENLGIVGSEEFGNTAIIIVNSLLPIPLVSKDMIKLWESFPVDVFHQMIIDNEIRGKELISLCVSNPKINKKCDSRSGSQKD